MNTSPLTRIRALETQLRAVVTALDIVSLPLGERKVIAALTNNLTDAKLDIRDFEMSDTRLEQLTHTEQARERLEQIRTGILAASEYNIFNAVDVAQFTAQLEQIVESIK